MVSEQLDSSVWLSRAGRLLRKTISSSNIVTVESDDSDSDSDFIRSPNKWRNPLKPSAFGPSTSRVAAQNKRTGTPGTSLLCTLGVYKRSESPDSSDHPMEDERDSDSSSGSSQTFEPNISDRDSMDTFDGFDENDVKRNPIKGKGLLNTVQYRLKHCKRHRIYKCHEKNSPVKGSGGLSKMSKKCPKCP